MTSLGDGATPAQLADWLADTTLALCGISSVTGDEARIATELLLRCAPVSVRVERLGNTIMAYGPEQPGRPCIALVGHSDTVLPAAEQPLKKEAGRVYGCGASDMKGGLAVMLALLADAYRHPALFGVNLRCIFYDKEEGPSAESGLLPLCAAGVLKGIDLAICLEPTDGRIHAGCLGGLQARVTVPGRRAHSARPWQGENALYAALPLLQQLRDTPRREVLISGLPFYEVFVATQAETKNSRNVVPDRFAVNVNYRFAPGKSIAQARSELIDFISAIEPNGKSYSVEILDEAPAGAVCIDDALLRGWQAQRKLEVAAKQAWTDVARFSELGIAAINFGPGDTAEAHQANESVSIAALFACCESLRALLLRHSYASDSGR